jgi:hypothetical protein
MVKRRRFANQAELVIQLKPYTADVPDEHIKKVLDALVELGVSVDQLVRIEVNE